MTGRALLYGATGFTGAQVAAELAGDVELVLAGRDGERVRAVAEPLGLAWRSFELTDTQAMDAALADIDVVLHAAGPFGVTARPMIDACLRTGSDYIDLGGEWPVFVDAMSLDAEARRAGVMLLPGIGLTVAASDCLCALAKERWSETVSYYLGISRAQVISRGSVASAAQMLSPDVIVRRAGQLSVVPAGSLVRAFDFGEGYREAAAMNWADVVTAAVSTGARDVEVYSEMRWNERASYRASSMTMDVTGAQPLKSLGSALAGLWPNDPGEDERAQASFTMVLHALDPWRRVRRLVMRTRDGYSFSVLTAAEAVRRVLGGVREDGFQTPALAFGSGFIFECDAARLEDVGTAISSPVAA